MPRTRKRPSQKIRKKKISKRQEASLKRHSKHHSAKHIAFMKRRMLMGDTMRQAHKKAMAKTGK
tara:strand:+ start:5970 stop:6161 length:192 start_codon:yes stop_codon:yes gene_type:complete